MRWVRDQSGRLPQRPHYDPEEIDDECEAIVTRFLLATHGAVRYPLSTNDLTILLEQETADLDLYADLAREGTGVEGATDFVPGEQPRVRIARALSEQPSREHRLRTTLAHELGHVKLHNFLWSWSLAQPAVPPAGDDGLGRRSSVVGEPALTLSGANGKGPSSVVGSALRCRRVTILGASPADWMEWQAGYACGAFLMPAGALARLVNALLDEAGASGPVFLGVPAAHTLIRRVQAAFDVSSQAARVRLLQTGHLTKRPRSRPLVFALGR